MKQKSVVANLVAERRPATNFSAEPSWESVISRSEIRTSKKKPRCKMLQRGFWLSTIQRQIGSTSSKARTRTSNRHFLWRHQFVPLDEFPNSNNVQLHPEVIGWTSQRLRILRRQVRYRGAPANPSGLLERLWIAPVLVGKIGNWKSS